MSFNYQGTPVYNRDPDAPDVRSTWSSFGHALLATALFRCWHILIFFGAWSTAICVISHNIHSLALQPTLITVFGTVLGFVISYRTTSSFERYNEGRRLWSQIVLGSRTFARTVWLHIPENAYPASQALTDEENKARTLIEKTSVVNLLEAFAVAVKHYLRGEDGIYYEDLYHLVKFLPTIPLPPTIPSVVDLTRPRNSMGDDVPASPRSGQFHGSGLTRRAPAPGQLPLPNTAPTPSTRVTTFATDNTLHVDGRSQKGEKYSTGPEELYLSPAMNPPKYSLFDLFPFSLLLRLLTKNGVDKNGVYVKGRRAARLRAAMRNGRNSYNIPLEISLYLGSYVSTLQSRKTIIDAPTTNILLATLTQLVDALTGLERILTTPIPFSYSIHLWLVTVVYCLALPFQVWSTLKWFTIPATVLASFIFFGFLVAGEEIERYDKNDLNMDHFVHNIIRKELRAIMAMPTPDPSVWAFSSENNLLFASSDKDERVPPSEWMRRGIPKMRDALTVPVQ
ncbi:Bestrophin, RFP-TM, chloride channel-domain-containing protein [Suillus clintonianus]|uniref:Bestrophin, RFP-TM, chloride channel-domain-containing protein n=1 Tax=Suillus clintonianus TaxID=1904413 RepID=UPI001B86EF4A|nr:Bestrophin, RFP-TM, chloride channel-domain-containing protein [Suillus clintonianus]KAG2130681.1 Bestrophin, RFP-TM, chloride channel-domain-containing protein [Suillus clintonianus]